MQAAYTTEGTTKKRGSARIKMLLSAAEVLRDLGAAAVTIDDQYIGTFAYVAAHGVAMPPGKHRVTVEKPGYFPWDRLVEARGPLVRLDVALVRVPE